MESEERGSYHQALKQHAERPCQEDTGVDHIFPVSSGHGGGSTRNPTPSLGHTVDLCYPLVSDVRGIVAAGSCSGRGLPIYMEIPATVPFSGRP